MRQVSCKWCRTRECASHFESCSHSPSRTSVVLCSCCRVRRYFQIFIKAASHLATYACALLRSAMGHESSQVGAKMLKAFARVRSLTEKQLYVFTRTREHTRQSKKESAWTKMSSLPTVRNKNTPVAEQCAAVRLVVCGSVWQCVAVSAHGAVGVWQCSDLRIYTQSRSQCICRARLSILAACLHASTCVLKALLVVVIHIV